VRPSALVLDHNGGRGGLLLLPWQGSGYAGGVFEQIGFSPAGDAAKHEYCYDISDDRKAVGLSVRPPRGGNGLCIISRLEGGTIIRNQARAMGEHEGCFP
jgi:hypothetical protein